ncbi:CoA-substrate-specific enzyme activase, putative [Desulfonauticus submarinus]|uniref:CoA-substrate-specific enzyme activase, putative n=1 Tax=Desulfonauticus submarinus TaxID=206665 RepID=A0A1H0EKV5_9BACT|nr:acyl-CoA dehydratase activase [Desulfonauticus submarinus]SDN83048.1 CoA-substrate-specific enzyme activase, putative [Desulfonauticus submarinus]
MAVAGIDIGSRSIEIVVLKKDKVIFQNKLPTTFNPLDQLKKIIKGIKFKLIVTTGYGRELINKIPLTCPIYTITEIKAYALGVYHLYPNAKTILDIGGQDTKAISLASNGKVKNFEMNDRCAAGTGKFLEFTASIFQIPIQKFGHYALKGKIALPINSMCTVFAETEAVSLMAKGEAPENIALGLHKSIVKRSINMLKRVGLKTPLIFAGGVANNPCVVHLLKTELDISPIIPPNPDTIGALGAALWGRSRFNRTQKNSLNLKKS